MYGTVSLTLELDSRIRRHMRYGFVIDQRKCIGCHACTVACKSENEVPLGVFRTWVKYVESGEFPNARRHFNVLRCNHCEDAPCVEICPTGALFKRPDGIVDFDNRKCIGCKACMQACPYDALYIDPDNNTAAKCNYCVHRVEQELLPACVVVCPVKAIIAGDIDDPTSEITRTIGSQPVTVRKPEQGTKPKVFYVGAEDASLTPEALALGQSYMWAELRGEGYLNGIDNHTLSGQPYQPAPELTPEAWESDPALAKPGSPRVAYDVHHPRPWGWKVSSYLWTKSIAAGSLGLAAVLLLAGWSSDRDLLEIVAPLLAVLFILITSVLLVVDLKRPERFWMLMVKPNRTSWLALGGYILAGFGALAGLWVLAGLAGLDSGWRALAVIGLPLAAAAAGYTAFLFGQAEGRDFWQSPLLLPHLLVQATVAGAGILALTAMPVGISADLPDVLGWVLLGGLVANLVVMFAELFSHHPTTHIARAASVMTVGRYSRLFWVGAVVVGVVIPLLLLIIFLAGGPVSALAVAAGLALVGLLAYEHAWVQSGQMVPLS
jgi:Fe-S-cluster-containing dehydrogenase component/formate-dependent nitrite reductase membrane component NrfD